MLGQSLRHRANIETKLDQRVLLTWLYIDKIA